MGTTNDGDPFDWDSGNRDHIDFEVAEVEQAVYDPDRIVVDAYNAGDERRWALLGFTEQGDILFVVYTHRSGKIRIVTARAATKTEQRRYRQRGK
jgi:uncharacterized DUF497 family protein